MIRRLVFSSILTAYVVIRASSPAMALETAYSGNYIIIENQSGFLAEEYEVRVAKKLERGLKNFFLGWLEIPNGVKTHIAYREDNYLPVGLETYVLGLFNGFGHGIKRTAVGFYEIFTPFYAQGPILVEMEEWLY